MASVVENGGDSSVARHLREQLRDVRAELESVRARLLIATESEASLAERLEATERRAPEALPQERARSVSQERAGAGDWSPSASVSASEPDLDHPTAGDDAADAGEPAAGDGTGDSARSRQRSGEREHNKVGVDVSGAGVDYAKSTAHAENNGGEGGGKGEDKSVNPLDDFFSQRPVASVGQDSGRKSAFVDSAARARSGSPATRQRYEADRERREVQEFRRRSRSRSRSGRVLVRRDTFSQQLPRSERRPARSEDRGSRNRHQDTLRSPSVGRRSPRMARSDPQFSASAIKGESNQRIDTFCKEHGLQDRARIIMYNMNKDDLDIVLKESYRMKEANDPTGFIITRIRNIERRAGRPLGMKTHEHVPYERRGVREVREVREVRDVRDLRDRDVRERGSPPRCSPQDSRHGTSLGDGRFGRERDRACMDDRHGAQGSFRSRSRSWRARQHEEPPRRRFDGRQ